MTQVVSGVPWMAFRVGSSPSSEKHWNTDLETQRGGSLHTKPMYCTMTDLVSGEWPIISNVLGLWYIIYMFYLDYTIYSLSFRKKKVNTWTSGMVAVFVQTGSFGWINVCKLLILPIEPSISCYCFSCTQGRGCAAGAYHSCLLVTATSHWYWRKNYIVFPWKCYRIFQWDAAVISKEPSPCFCIQISLLWLLCCIIV